jgi:hypothetical protein
VSQLVIAVRRIMHESNIHRLKKIFDSFDANTLGASTKPRRLEL